MATTENNAFPKKEQETVESGIIELPAITIEWQSGKGSGVVLRPNTSQPPAQIELATELAAEPQEQSPFVLQNVILSLIFWGSAWTMGETTPTMGDVLTAVVRILSGNYMLPLDQYQGIGPGSLRDVALVNVPILNSPANPPNPFTIDDVRQLVLNLMSAGKILDPRTNPFNNFSCVIMPPHVRYNQPPATDQHRFIKGTFGSFYAHYGWVMNDGTLDYVTSNFSHELVEAVTDPRGTGFQVVGSPICQPNPNDWCEIADVCGLQRLSNGLLVAQYWSNRDNACIAP